MLLQNLQSSRCVLLKDDIEKNVIPIVVHTVLQVAKDTEVAFFCYERPIQQWKEIFSYAVKNIKFHDESIEKVNTSDKKIAVFVDSYSQMNLVMGFQKSLLCLHNLLNNPNVTKVFIVYHMDCQKSSKVEIQLDHIAQLILTPYESDNTSKLVVLSQLKKAGKILKFKEEVSYHNKESNIFITSTLVSKKRVEDTVEQVLPHKLTTFKIGLENQEIKARDGLELPYLKKQETGKVYYEHDEADDWDDEDPDEDLDI